MHPCVNTGRTMALLIYPGHVKQITGTRHNESAQQSLITYTKQCTLTGNEFAMILKCLIYIHVNLKAVLHIVCKVYTACNVGNL